MNNYVPFLKFKTNEIGALGTLMPNLQEKTYPFFDLPKKNGMSEASFAEMVGKLEKAYKKHLKKLPAIFIDNYDIDDSIKISGNENYALVVEKFGLHNAFVPVIALDRPKARNDLVFQAKAAGQIASSAIAVRLQPDDFQSYAVIEDDLKNFQSQGSNLFSYWTLIFDNRVCTNVDPVQRSAQINKFLQKAAGNIQIQAVIVAGSSFPASISELMKVQTEIHHPRRELDIFRPVAQAAYHQSIFLGDYTIVSPLYSDVSIPVEAMQNVIAAKTIYSYGDTHYVVRGGALKTHRRGRLQYNDIANRIVSQKFYRGFGYSSGDLFLHEKASLQGAGVTPSSILKPTINAHITYMFNDFPG